MADKIHHASARDWRRAAELVGGMEATLGNMEGRLVRRGYRRDSDVVARLARIRVVLSLLADDFNDCAGKRGRPLERDSDGGFTDGDGI